MSDPATTTPRRSVWHPTDTHDAALESARRRASEVAEDLERELAAIAESTRTGPDDEHDAEGATVGFERARVGALLTAARESLVQLDHAVARSHEGRGDICERCGASIGEERRSALPGTDRCLPCARVASES